MNSSSYVSYVGILIRLYRLSGKVISDNVCFGGWSFSVVFFSMSYFSALRPKMVTKISYSSSDSCLGLSIKGTLLRVDEWGFCYDTMFLTVMISSLVFLIMVYTF